MIKRWFFVGVLLLALAVAAHAAKKPLPAETAFPFHVVFSSPSAITVTWQVAPGYFLYAEKLRLEQAHDHTNIPLEVPQGEFKYDPVQGRQEVLQGTVNVSFKEALLKDTNTELLLHFQGCSKDGFCYPPEIKKLTVDLLQKRAWAHENAASTLQQPLRESGLSLWSWSRLVSDQHAVEALLKSQSTAVILLLFFILGVLLAFTPCVLPMIPILSTILVGNHGSTSSMRAFLLSLAYVLGAASAYALAGIFAAQLGQSLQVMLQNPFVILIMVALFLYLAALNFGWLNLKNSLYWQKLLAMVNHRLDASTYTGVFLMGVISTLVVSPCITAPLIGVLIYISQTGQMWFGAASLFIMGLGLGVPLLIAGSSLRFILPKSGIWLTIVKHLFGFMMIAMAVWLLGRMLLPWWHLLVIALGWLAFSIYLCLFMPRYIKTLPNAWLLGLVISFLGFALIYHQGERLALQFAKAQNEQETRLPWHTVYSLSEYQQALQQARIKQQPVIVDFFATWCASCLTMEKSVIEHSEIQAELRRFYRIRVDISQNTESERALMQSLEVIAPPTFLLYDAKLQEQTDARLVGEVDRTVFLEHLKRINDQNHHPHHHHHLH